MKKLVFAILIFGAGAAAYAQTFSTMGGSGGSSIPPTPPSSVVQYPTLLIP